MLPDLMLVLQFSITAFLAALQTVGGILQKLINAGILNCRKLKECAPCWQCVNQKIVISILVQGFRPSYFLLKCHVIYSPFSETECLFFPTVKRFYGFIMRLNLSNSNETTTQVEGIYFWIYLQFFGISLMTIHRSVVTLTFYKFIKTASYYSHNEFLKKMKCAYSFVIALLSSQSKSWHTSAYA